MYRIKLKYDDGHYRVTNSPTLCLSHALLHEFERKRKTKDNVLPRLRSTISAKNTTKGNTDKCTESQKKSCKKRIS